MRYPRIVALALCIAPLRVEAFVCTRAGGDARNPNGPSLSWPERSLPYSLATEGTVSLPPQATFAVLRNAFAVWQNLSLAPGEESTCGNAPGSDLQFIEVPAPASMTWVGYNFLNPRNNANVLVFRDKGWPTATGAIDVIALTTTTYSALNGTILDADIEFNSATFRFVVDTPNAEQTDLLNTAVHEVGHFIGLAHCDSAACAPGEVMAPTSAAGEVTKRQLKCADRQGATFKYPAGQPNGYCTTTPDAACGFCAPPQGVAVTPSIVATARSAGRSDGCQAAPTGWLALGLVALCMHRAHRLRQRRSPARRRPLLGMVTAAIVSVLGSSSAGCGQVECDGNAPSFDPNAPMIVGMRLHSQVASDPWRVILATQFVDYDGNLGRGRAEYFANNNTVAREKPSLERIFSSSGGIALDATSGEIALPLRFSQSTPTGAVLHLGTQLVDQAERRSNCYTLDLAFDLKLTP